MIVGKVHNDGRQPRPWVYRVRAGDRVDHRRFHDKASAKRDRAKTLAAVSKQT